MRCLAANSVSAPMNAWSNKSDILADMFHLSDPADIEPGQVVTVGPLPPTLVATLTERFRAWAVPEGLARDGFLVDHGARVRIVVTTGTVGVSTELMSRLPSLEAVVHFGVGYDNTDLASARARGIVVSNTPGVLDDCVADTALAMYLNLLRRFPEADRFVRNGQWHTGQFPLQHRASRRAVGILGLGRIGCAIASRLDALGCTISYHNRHERADVPYSYAVSPLELARNAEVLVVASSGGPENRGLVSRRVLEALGPDGYLINVARGSVVDETALIEMLETGKIAGAGLDVFAEEPDVPERLCALDQVVLLPHLASATLETRADMEGLTLANIAGYLAIGCLRSPV